MTLLLSNSFAHLFFREGCGKARMQINLQNGVVVAIATRNTYL